jgi:hypothetical protein
LLTGAINQQVDGTPDADGRDNWYAGIQKANSLNPLPYFKITTKKIIVAEENTIVWYWSLTNVGSAQYPVSGMQLLHVNEKKQIYLSEFEFNSISWGTDTSRIKAYCT